MFRKTLTVILNIVIVAFLAVAVLVILSRFSVGGLHTYTVLSGSMEPAIHTGSFIFVRPAATYEVDDTVTRTTKDREVSVTHRIVEKAEKDGVTVYRTKGDANDVADAEDVPESAIVGKVMLSIPYLGFAVDYAKKPAGFIILIVIPAVIIIYEELGKLKREAVLLWSRWRMSRDFAKDKRLDSARAAEPPDEDRERL